MNSYSLFAYSRNGARCHMWHARARVCNQASQLIAETSVETLLNSVDFTIFKLTLSNYAAQGFFMRAEVRPLTPDEISCIF